MKKIRLTEDDLHAIINESIREALNESRTVRYKIDRIYKALQKSGIGNKVYRDCYWQAKDDYNKVITSLGGDFNYWCENGGYTDYDKNDNMPRSKEYKVRISFEDGDVIGGYMKFMAAGSVEDPFDRYDTCMVLWPERNVDESKNGNKSLTESFNHWKSPKLVQIIKQHGMPKYSDINTNYTLTQLTDDNIDGEVTDRPTNHDEYFKLGDGKYLNVNCRDNEAAHKYFGTSDHHYAPRKLRPNNGFAKARSMNDIPSDFYSRRHYAPMTTRGRDANDLRHNPWFKNGKNKDYPEPSGWNRKSADRAMNNLRQGNDRFGNPNKQI